MALRRLLAPPRSLQTARAGWGLLRYLLGFDNPVAWRLLGWRGEAEMPNLPRRALAVGRAVVRHLLKALRRRMVGPYQLRIVKNEPDQAQLSAQRLQALKFGYQPKISLIVPVFNVPERMLAAMIDSVLRQTYGRWELCLADGGSPDPRVRAVLDKYSRLDQRIRVRFLDKNMNIAGNSNAALALATGEFVGLLDHDDTLAPFALYEMANLLNERPELDLIYSDEDKISEDGCRRFDPHCKPDWAPDTFRSHNYICHFTVIRKALVDEVGGFRTGYDGSQDYDLFLRITEKTRKIWHIPKILYHWRSHEASAADGLEAKPYACAAAERALSDHVQRLGWEGRVRHDGYGSYRVQQALRGTPKISIIIPTRDKVALLKACLNSILGKSTYPNYEIVLIDTNSAEAQTHAYYDELRRHPRIKILSFGPQPFNFSAANNFAARRCDGAVLLFLNNDTEVISRDWLEAMLEFAQRPDVGAVGAKLYYTNDTVQHGGVIVGLGGVAGHAHNGLRRDSPGYLNRLVRCQNLSAVTAACLMMRRDVFAEIGMFGEAYQLAFGDVDLCLKAREKGYLVVWTPYAELYHRESASRGYEETHEQMARFEKGCALFRRRWADILAQGDPYYNPNFSLKNPGFQF